MASEGQLVSQGKVRKGLGCAQGSRNFLAVHSFHQWNGSLSPIPDVGDSNKFYTRRSLIVAIKDVFET